MATARECQETAAIYHKHEWENTMNIATIALILSVIVLPGCFTMHVDSMTRFSITGEVFDKVSGKPLEKVNVAFIDTGLDSVRSKAGVPKTIGESDAQGKIDLKFDYWWGVEKGLFKKKPTLTFDIEVSKENYKSERVHFRSSELAREDNIARVPLKMIYLAPVPVAKHNL